MEISNSNMKVGALCPPPLHTMCRSGSEMRTIIDANRTLTLFTSFQVGIVSQGSGGDCANLNHPGKLE